MSFSDEIKLKVKRKAHFSCCLCHSLYVEIHHIIPEAEHGPDTENNAAPLGKLGTVAENMKILELNKNHNKSMHLTAQKQVNSNVMFKVLNNFWKYLRIVEKHTNFVYNINGGIK